MASPETFKRIHQKCAAAALLFDLDVIDLLVFARIESNFDPLALNASSGAAGCFQFLRSTAAEENIDPMNLAEATAATARRMAADVDYLRRIGRTPSALALYLCHQQGRKGATQIFNAADGLEHLTEPRLKNILANLPKTVARRVANPDLTAQEQATIFVNWWGDRVNRAEKEVYEHIAN